MDRPIIVAELGSGGMAEVFLAMRRGMGGFVKLVVVKRMRESALEGDGIAMFLDEARISARLNHPNVVQTNEVGPDGKGYSLEMEYLDGQPLHRIMSRAKKASRPIPLHVAVAVVREALAGLHYAHELADYDGTPLGIVHRDVSPQNVFVTYDGRVKVVDFGIAKVAGQSSVTQMGMVKGKIRYMAPEQATSGAVDRRADVFAAGIILWQLIVGKPYWGDADELAIFGRLSRGELPPNARSVNPAVPEALDAICARALASNPDERYATAEDFQHALEGCGLPIAGAERALGTLTGELFADMRQAIRNEIEKAAARPDPTPSQAELDSPTNIQRINLSADLDPNAIPVSERPVSKTQDVVAQAPRAASSKGTTISLVALTCVAALAVVVLVKRPDAPPPAETAAAASAPPPKNEMRFITDLAPHREETPAAAPADSAPSASAARGPHGGRGAAPPPRTRAGATPAEGAKPGHATTEGASGSAGAGAAVDAGAGGGAGHGGRVLKLDDGNPWNAPPAATP